MGGCCSSANNKVDDDNGAQEDTVDFAFNITRPTILGRATKFTKKIILSDKPKGPSPIAEKKKVSAVSILSRKGSDSKGLEAEGSSTKVKKRGTKLSFHECDEIRDYEKGAAIQEDDELRKKSKFKRISKMSITEDDTNANFKKLVVMASRTFSRSDTALK